jgi:hypothetical protein
MINAICLVVALVAPSLDEPYNYVGKLTDFMNEGAAWGMPSTGLPMQITLSEGGAKISQTKFGLRGPKWTADAPLNLNDLKFASSSLAGSVQFKNSSGFALDAVRFDIVSASERYKGKDAEGKEVVLTRALPLKQESPILFGDMPKDTEAGPFEVKATGLDWKPETVDITVTAKLSGLTFQRTLFDGHPGSWLDLDSKGRLYVGSGHEPGIYRANLTNGSLDLITSTPSSVVPLAINPVDGTIAATWLNSHVFNIYTPGGDEKQTIAENGEIDGMASWPQMAHYDAKGNLYLMFGTSVVQMAGEKPAFVLKGSGQYEFSGYAEFDVAGDGTIFVASESNVFRFAPGGKSGKKILQGPSPKLGRTHGIMAIRVDSNGYLWVVDEYDGEFSPRICVFDRDGKFVWTFGRGGPTHHQDPYYDGQIFGVTKSIAVAPDGRVYVSNDVAEKSVLEFVMF